MAPTTHLEYVLEPATDYKHKKFQNAYTHKKFGKRLFVQRSVNFDGVAGSTMDQPSLGQTNTTHHQQPYEQQRKSHNLHLFRPYALNEKSTPRKRRISELRVEPTANINVNLQTYGCVQQQSIAKRPVMEAAYLITNSPSKPLPFYGMTQFTLAPELNRQTFAVILQKQRDALQIRQLMNINPDTNTWPMEWRNALYTILH